MRLSRLLAVVAASLVFVGTASAKAMLPHHKPFHTMSLRQLADYQRLTLKRDGYSIRWWKTHKPSRVVLNARARRFPSCLGARMPRAVCWHYKHRAWTKPLYRKTMAVLHPPAAKLPFAFWDCVATGRLNGVAVSRGEGGATSVDPTGTYYGRYQMDKTFMGHWGADMLRKYGGRDATHWSVLDQTIVAERGFHGQGAYAWPNTAPPCLSLR